MTYDDFQFLQFDHRGNGVLVVTLNRPEVMNATNARLHWELTRIWGVVNDDPQVRVVVVTGAGDRAFSAGGDLDWVADTAGNPEMVANTLKEAGDIVFNMLAPGLPMGGWKESGIGYRNGEYGIKKYCRSEAIVSARTLLGSEPLWYPYTPKRRALVRKLGDFLKGRDLKRRLGRK